MESIIKEEAALERTTPTSNVSVPLWSGKVNLCGYRKEHGLTGNDIAQAVKDGGFVSCDKQIVSKVENIAYGVDFVPAAKRAIFSRYGNPREAVKRRDSAGRKRGYKLCVRFSKGEYSAVLRAKEASGFDSMQDYLWDLIMRDALGAIKNVANG